MKTSTSRPNFLEFAGAVVAYGLVLVASIVILNSLPHSSPLRVPVALAPMLPGLLVVVAVVRHMGRLDELQRRILLESLAIAFAGTAVITFGYGFLENVGFPQLSWFAVWPLMAVLWIIGEVVGQIRY